MSDEGIVGSLTYLSGYLDETKARVRELEKELEDVRNSPVKDEPGASSTRLQDLESENEALRQELVAVKASGKVKKERTDVKLESPDVDPSAATVPNSALADSRQMCRKLEEQCADLQKKIQETTELAAKALRERVEGEKIMDSVRRELKELRKTNDAANEASAAEIEAKDAAIDSLKAKNKTLRTSSQEYKTSYETVVAEKEELQQTLQEMIEVVEGEVAAKGDLQQTLREMIDVVEGLQEEVAANTDCGKCGALEVERTKLEEKFETTIAGFRERALEFEKTMMNEADAKYRQYMKALPLPENRPPFAQLDPVCCRDNNLHAYISQDPNAKSFLNHILYLPKRTIRMFDFHYVCFGPTQQYDRVTKQWTKGSDLTSLHRGTRELFINAKEFIFYAGTYKCHDLRPLFPKGSVPHAHVSVPEIRDAALGVPLPPDHRSIIEECYPDGKIKVEATGLQCIGFNVQLYDSLRRRFAKDSTGNDNATEVHVTEGKRKAEDEINPVGKKQKA